MRVIVKLINEQGRRLDHAQFTAMASFRGILRVNEERRQHIGRFAVVAHLLSDSDGALADLLPSLRDVLLTFVRDGQMRLTGTEEVNGIQYNQTWDVTVPA